MIDEMDTWRYAARRLVLRSSPQTSEYAPVPPPPGLEPPPLLDLSENGYAALARSLEKMPGEEPYDPDLNHRRRVLPHDRDAAERALAPLRPYLEGIDGFLDAPAWQIPMVPEGSWPELPKIRRLGYALLLRGALEGRGDDRERAIRLARRLRRSEGVFIHFLIGLSLEQTAEGPLTDVAQDRRAAVRSELARYAVPRAHLVGPWSPPCATLPPSWDDARRAVQWLLAEHPDPYDPADTVAALVLASPLMAEGSPEALRGGIEELGAGWPAGMRDPDCVGPGGASLRELREARRTLRGIGNPYGRLSVAHHLRAAAHLAAAVEKATA